MKLRIISDESGYTLLETVVALALFTSVLIPIGVTIGNFFLDGSVDKLRLALRECESEITQIVASKDYSNNKRVFEGSLILHRTIEHIGGRLEIYLVVSSTNLPTKAILTLHKTLLVSD